MTHFCLFYLLDYNPHIMPNQAPPLHLAWQIGIATLARFALNTSRRFVYPFIPALSRGLGVPLTDVTALIAVNQATGLLSSLFGPLSDHWGYRRMMLIALAALMMGMVAGGSLPFYSMMVLAVFLAGLGKNIFDPAIQAYIGERVPYQRRGMVIGITEFAWAASSLLGIPLAGLLIDRLGWRSPFWALGGLALLSLVGLRLLFPADRPHLQHVGALAGFWAAWRRLIREPAALGAIGFSLLISAANDNLFVVYGVWLEQDFGLVVLEVGLATTVIGLAELLGETLTASLSDRLGLKRAVLMALVLSTLSYLLLPVLAQTLPLALLGLFIIFLTFEFTIVTSMSLFTEILPGARATMMSAYLAAAGLGRVIGALAGGSIWLAGGLPVVCIVSAVSSGLGLVSLSAGLRRWRS
jgi:MFS transporter, DHA1 family, inner membrane transport protein